MSDKPLVVIDDTMLAQGANVIKSCFPDATDELCNMAALGAFAAILSEREGGNVRFATSESDEVYYNFGCSADRRAN